MLSWVEGYLKDEFKEGHIGAVEIYTAQIDLLGFEKML